MFGFLKRIFFGKSLGEVLNELKVIKVHGVRFVIKKVNVMAFLDGSRVMLEQASIYKLKKAEEAQPQMSANAIKSVQEHYTDMFCASIVEPKIVRKKDDAKDGAIFVDYLFTDWNLANELYTKIVEYTYGKKKSKPNFSLATS